MICYSLRIAAQCSLMHPHSKYSCDWITDWLKNEVYVPPLLACGFSFAKSICNCQSLNQSEVRRCIHTSLRLTLIRIRYDTYIAQHTCRLLERRQVSTYIYFFKHFHNCNHDNNTYNQTISPSAYYPDADEENLFTALFV